MNSLGDEFHEAVEHHDVRAVGEALLNTVSFSESVRAYRGLKFFMQRNRSEFAAIERWCDDCMDLAIKNGLSPLNDPRMVRQYHCLHQYLCRTQSDEFATAAFASALSWGEAHEDNLALRRMLCQLKVFARDAVNQDTPDTPMGQVKAEDSEALSD